jgi:2-polyprenyl-3-methyl-5-hydroxy-6-metoxy-1,4-benzoquinol methylase
MLAKAQLTEGFEAWNRRWGAPSGRHFPLEGLVARRAPGIARYVRGPFGFQSNSPTRRYEYPWVASKLRGEHRLLEIGGALSGLQFSLAKGQGAEVHNVDPLINYGNGPREYEVSPAERHAAMNACYKTKVVLHHSVLEDADLEGPFDAVYSVSTLEHMQKDAIERTLGRIDNLLRPGGRLVLTADLFLDAQPFCSAESNRWGTNISMAWLAEVTGYDLVEGDRRELFGYPEFSTDYVLCNLGEYSMYASQLAQCAVFVKGT